MRFSSGIRSVEVLKNGFQGRIIISTRENRFYNGWLILRQRLNMSGFYDDV